MTTLLTPAQLKQKSFESRRNFLLLLLLFNFFYPGRMRLMFTLYPNLSEGADRIGGQNCCHKYTFRTGEKPQKL